jgi:hypothetical protein
MKAEFRSDKAILQELAKQVAEIAADPGMEETKRLWKKLNSLHPDRPMVIADQICWNEMDVDGFLVLQCQDKDCKGFERELRRAIYRRKYMPDDLVIEPVIRVSKAVTGMSLGIEIHEETNSTDDTNDVVSHHYENQISTMEDIQKIQIPTIGHNQGETERRLGIAHEIFDGILTVKAEGVNPYLSVWDPIATWMGVENALYAIMDEPDMIHALVQRVVDAYMSMLDQLEVQGLLCSPQPVIHCTGAYTDELPKPGYDPDTPRTQDIWMYGLAQMLGTCSPDMYNEFEIEHCMPLFHRFGLVYYGCCDPMDRKIGYVKQIKNARKISISPWANEEMCAADIGTDRVFSRKPNPALLAFESFDESLIRADLQRTAQICAKYHCPLELIQKDISTLHYQPQRLWSWVKIAKEIALSQ